LRNEDIGPFAAMNADTQVMQYFPRPWSYQESEAALTRIIDGFQTRGFGLYATEDASRRFIGIVGLSVPAFKSAFTPCVEILWRLASSYWGKGYASEAASSVLAVAFTALTLDEVVAFATTGNQRSMRVMDRIGMTNDVNGDFDHPDVANPALRRHVLYRITHAQWSKRAHS
jgi:RimJ/RimL family protein N-acetyltransferase